MTQTITLTLLIVMFMTAMICITILITKAIESKQNKIQDVNQLIQGYQERHTIGMLYTIYH